MGLDAMWLLKEGAEKTDSTRALVIAIGWFGLS